MDVVVTVKYLRSTTFSATHNTSISVADVGD